MPGMRFVALFCLLVVYVTAERRFRISGGGNEGLVEVLHDGTWGTVCDDGFGWTEGDMVCKALGLGHATALFPGGGQGQGTGKIWIDNLQCVDAEDCLNHCEFPGWGLTNCHHGEDVGVRCGDEVVERNPEVVDDHPFRTVPGDASLLVFPQPGVNYNAKFRLVDGDGTNGIVEVFYAGLWGKACAQVGVATIEDAHFVCSMLGFNKAAWGQAIQGVRDVMITFDCTPGQGAKPNGQCDPNRNPPTNTPCASAAFIQCE